MDDSTEIFGDSAAILVLFCSNLWVIQPKLVGDSAEKFWWNYWVNQLKMMGIQLKMIGDSAENDGSAATLGRLSWNSQVIQLKLLEDSAEAIGRLHQIFGDFS